jgi:hypothetical protein
MIPTFWKLSHGQNIFSYEEILDAINKRLVYVHKDTKPKGTSTASQGNNFIKASIGDYFYLTHGNQGIYLLGQFTGPANLFSEHGEGWIDRPYRSIKSAIKKDPYFGDHKWWSPNDNSTFMQVPESELAMFEEYILNPFFGVRLSDYGLNI